MGRHYLDAFVDGRLKAQREQTDRIRAPSVVVVRVQPANVAPGLELSSEVEAALPTLVEAVLSVLEAWF